MNVENCQAKVLWAKKAKGNRDETWLPLLVHISDAAKIARLVWHHWLPSGTRRRITEGICKDPEPMTDAEDKALACFIFLAATHDLGKATPAFQGKLGRTELDEQLRQQLFDAGLSLPNIIHTREVRHYWASQIILENNGFSRKLAVILGGHHGQPPNTGQLTNLNAYKKDLGWDKGQESWCRVQRELLAYALELAGVSEQEARSWQPDITAQVLLSGLVIMVDWIVSNETHFPYTELSANIRLSEKRIRAAWEELNLPKYWDPDNTWVSRDKELFEKRFDISEPRPVQAAVLKILENVISPGIVIIEAPMGEGKTEAALAAAELMARRMKRSGVFFALPTQASANGLFLRFCRWIERLEDGVGHSVQLAHGKANLNELYNQIEKATKEAGGYWVGGEDSEETDEDAIIVHDWLSGRKKGILADFVIGTIDQVLMAGLKQKHLAMRHLGLANKVVILDECHAYDAYMSQYLYKVLNWLGACKVPVIVLSATLPGEKRKQLFEAYLNKDIAPVPEYDPIFDNLKPEPPPLPSWVTTLNYPIITFTEGYEVRQEVVYGEKRSHKITLEVLADNELIPVLEDLLSEGGCAGIIVNSVKRAQTIARELRQHFGEKDVQLLHSRFISMDRAQKEKDIFDRLGANGKRPYRYIVVGTQIFEQSCDLDFDVLITDICPMDLLIQRIGRLHRHSRKRPHKTLQPKCYILGIYDSGFERGTELIYSKYILMNTRTLLPQHLTLPDDIPRLVQNTYDPDGVYMPPELQEEYQEARNQHEHQIAKKVTKANSFQISDPYRGLQDLVGWLDTRITDDPSGKRGEATVRDTVDSLEVLVVQKRRNSYYMLPWLAKYKGCEIPIDTTPPSDLARKMAECSIQLPRELCWKMDSVIEELERISLHQLRAWQQSPWLKGELFLVLDEQFCTELGGYHLHYDRDYGLFSKKCEKEDVNAGESV